VAALAQVRDGPARDQEGGGQVHVDHLPPQFERAVGDRSHAQRRAGVVEEDVKSSGAIYQLVHDSVDLCLVGQVRLEQQSASPGLLNGRQRGASVVRALVVVNSDEGAGAGQRQRRGLSDTHAAAGHQGDAAAQARR
jgi:hypothetical protein